MNLSDIKDLPVTAICLLKLDGSGGIEAKTCGTCGKHLVAAICASGLRKRHAELKPIATYCMNTSHLLGLPCPRALGAKAFLDIMKNVGCM